MDTSRSVSTLARVRDALRLAFGKDYPPHHTAVSFALGIFVTTLPTLGIGIPVLAWVGYRFERANRLALFAAVAILNPLAKSGIYVVSFLIGVQLLGSVPDISHADVGVDAGADVLVRLLVGNVILAIGFTIVGYVVAYRTVHAVHNRR